MDASSTSSKMEATESPTPNMACELLQCKKSRNRGLMNRNNRTAPYSKCMGTSTLSHCFVAGKVPISYQKTSCSQIAEVFEPSQCQQVLFASPRGMLHNIGCRGRLDTTNPEQRLCRISQASPSQVPTHFSSKLFKTINLCVERKRAKHSWREVGGNGAKVFRLNLTI